MKHIGHAHLTVFNDCSKKKGEKKEGKNWAHPARHGEKGWRG